jgi:hypothetical protein
VPSLWHYNALRGGLSLKQKDIIMKVGKNANQRHFGFEDHREMPENGKKIGIS